MRKTFSFMLLASAAISLAACGNGGSGSVPEGQTIATVDGKDVTIHELNAELKGANLPSGAQRKLIEQGFGWAKTIGQIRQVMVRGLKRVDQMFVLNMAAYNLVRMRTLAQVRPQGAG